MTRLLVLPTLSAIALALGGATAPPVAKVAPKGTDVSATFAQPKPVANPARPARRQSPRRMSPVLAAVSSANKAATLEPARQGFINAAQIYPFADGALYQIYASPERVTDIGLQPGEVLGAVASGDTVRWVIGDASSGTGADKRTHVLIKPFAAGLSTNLVITTDRRTYHLAVASTAGAALAAVSWTYPQDALIALKRAESEAQIAAPVATGVELDQLHFNYGVSGDPAPWRPLRAFDDGRQTFIEFPASLSVGEAPPLFLVDAHGAAQLVNYRLRGRFYVVDRLFDVAELRLGTKHQQVVRISRIAQAGGDARGRRAS